MERGAVDMAKSDINNEKCKECYEKMKKEGTLLPCEVLGYCKHVRVRGW